MKEIRRPIGRLMKASPRLVPPAIARYGAPLIGCVILVSCLAPAVAGTVRGRVFLDANGNGAADPGEQGVAGCMISDENTIVRTDANGAYQLELGGPAAVFVVNTPGTVPAGRWWSWIPDATTDAACDFPLRAEKQDGPLYFVQGTDIHVHPGAAEMARRYVAHVNALPVPVNFVVHTGDLVIDATMATMERAKELFDLYEEVCRPLKAPLKNIMGNHDIAGAVNLKLSGNEPDFGKTLFRRRFGPTTYAFRHGRYHFIALDATMVQDRAIAYGLTRESADWAIAYLETVASDEPIVLLVHEPMFPEVGGVRQPDTPDTRPHESRLQRALAGKKLLMTLAGHVHSRSETSWAGAPHILGGAVSYAWHGILPYPPTPRGYMLFRLEGDGEEHVYLDWAEERSIDITSPAFSATLRGRQPIQGIVADPEGRVSTVECAIGGISARANLSRRGKLAQKFEATLDTGGLTDGAYDLLVTAGADGKNWQERHPAVVVNGAQSKFEAKGDARLSFRAVGELPEGTEVICNGSRLAPGEHRQKEIIYQAPRNILRRLNEIVIRPGAAPIGGKPPVLQGITLEYEGSRYRDVRHAPLERRPLGPTGVTSYVDLVYEDVAIQAPRPK